jgi:hypothetical protein
VGQGLLSFPEVLALDKDLGGCQFEILVGLLRGWLVNAGVLSVLIQVSCDKPTFRQSRRGLRMTEFKIILCHLSNSQNASQ